MATLASDLIAATRQHLLGGTREQVNKLAVAVSTTAQTTLTFTHELAGITAGSVVSVGLERMYVWSTNDATKTALVERGWEGSTATTHLIDTVCRVNSRYDDFAIFRAVNDDIADLSSPENGLYRIRSVDLTYTPATYGYNLTSVSDMIGDPLQVTAEFAGPSGNWVRLPQSAWRLDSSADTTDFASGKALFLLDGQSGHPVRVVYRAPFVALTALTSDVQTVSFLPASCNDIPPLGAAYRLTAGLAVQRADMTAQGSARRAEEVSTNDTLNAGRRLWDLRAERIRAEASRLDSNFPVLL